MAKAKSRLTTITTHNKPAKVEEKPTKSLGIFHRYRRQLPTLGLAVACWFAMALLIATTTPEQVANWIIPQSYLVLLVLAFLAVFFTAAFLLLHTRRAVIAALLLVTFLFFQVQHVIFTWPLVGVILIFFAILDLGLSLIAYGWRSPKTK